MKKLVIALAGSLFLASAAPVFACPHSEQKPAETTAPKTADKAKDKDKAKPAKPAEKDTAKDKKTEKKDETVAKT